MKKVLPFVIIAGVLAAVFGGGFLLMSPANSPVQQPAVATQPAAANTGAAGPRAAAGGGTQTQQQQGAPAPADNEPPRHVRGQAAAPVLVEEYSDFQCPTCGRMHPVVKQLSAKYPSQVRVAFRHYPLPTIHRNAREAARAAEAAAAQSRFWDMHDMLYDKQAEWSNADPARPFFVKYAQTLGLDAARFQQDIDSSGVAMRVVADERRAAARRIQGTPTFLVNGRELKFEESNTLEKLSAAVERAMGGK